MSQVKNVVMIMCDSWQFNYLGCYGNDWIKTPNIDRLARESTLFENAYAEGLPTIPVRRALATGRYTLPFAGWVPLGYEDTTLADVLYRNHTQTALIADCPMMHLPKYGYSRGFDRVVYQRGQEGDHFYQNDPLLHLSPVDFHKPWHNPETKGTKYQKEADISMLTMKELMSYLSRRQHWTSDEDQYCALTCREAVRYLEKNVDREKPFFLWADFFDPHEPWDPPSVYDPDMKCPYDPDYEGKDLILPVPNKVEGMYTEEEMHHIRMLYAEKITMTDKWVGVLLDRMKQLGFYENTMIVFLADHGEPLGNGEHGHGLMRKCRPWPYEELVHIPLIIRHPDVEPQRNDSFVQTPDIAPTVLDYFGVEEEEIREEIQGLSLMPLIKGEKEKLRDFAIAGYHNFSWSIITEDWSYIHWLHEGEFSDDLDKMVGFYAELTEQMIPDLYEDSMRLTKEDKIWSCTPGAHAETPDIDELYNRREDPFQLNNIIKDKKKTANDLWVQLRDYMLELKST
ncbi:MAG: sulfatase, partial [Thermodesulfobacteriota bacterium]